jgi:uncharacterized membrane protein
MNPLLWIYIPGIFITLLSVLTLLNYKGIETDGDTCLLFFLLSLVWPVFVGVSGIIFIIWIFFTLMNYLAKLIVSKIKNSPTLRERESREEIKRRMDIEKEEELQELRNILRQRENRSPFLPDIPQVSLVPEKMEKTENLEDIQAETQTETQAETIHPRKRLEI